MEQNITLEFLMESYQMKSGKLKMRAYIFSLQIEEYKFVYQEPKFFLSEKSTFRLILFLGLRVKVQKQ